MNGYGVYDTSDEFLEEFIEPEDRASVRATAAQMASEHRKSSRRSQITAARTNAVRESKARRASTITVRAPRTSPARTITVRVSRVSQAVSATTTRSVLKASGAIPHLVGHVIRLIQDMQRTRL